MAKRDGGRVGNLAPPPEQTFAPDDGVRLYSQAYLLLDSERSFLEQIPWSSIMAYCREYQFDLRQTEIAVYCIRMVDQVILTERRRKHGQSKGPSPEHAPASRKGRGNRK